MTLRDTREYYDRDIKLIVVVTVLVMLLILTVLPRSIVAPQRRYPLSRGSPVTANFVVKFRAIISFVRTGKTTGRDSEAAHWNRAGIQFPPTGVIKLRRPCELIACAGDPDG